MLSKFSDFDCLYVGVGGEDGQTSIKWSVYVIYCIKLQQLYCMRAEIAFGGKKNPLVNISVLWMNFVIYSVGIELKSSVFN